MVEIYNQFKVGGHLVSKAVTLGVNSDTRMNWMMITLSLEVEEGKRVDLQMFANELKKDGQPNRIYQNMETIKNSYLSLNSTIKNKRNNPNAEALKDESTTVGSLEEADFVRANKGVTLGMNRYMSQDGELRESFRLSVNFVNRVENEAQKVGFIEGTLTGVVGKKGRIVEGDDYYPTIELIVPEYRNAYGDFAERVVVDKYPLVLRLNDEDAKEYIENEFVEGSVVSVGVEPVNQVIVKQQAKAEKRGFGKQLATFESTEVVRELQITGGYVLDEDEYENEKNFDRDLYTKALEDFDKSIQTLKDGVGQTKSFAPSGFGKSPKSSSGGSLPF